MNKPTLNILGRKHNIVAVVVEDKDKAGDQRHVYDSETFGFMDEQDKADFSQVIENPSQAEKFIERLEATIKESKDYIMGLKMQIVENVVENIDLPFPAADLKPIVDEMKEHLSFIEGLEAALDIAKGGRTWEFGKAVSEVSSTECE